MYKMSEIQPTTKTKAWPKEHAYESFCGVACHVFPAIFWHATTKKKNGEEESLPMNHRFGETFLFWRVAVWEVFSLNTGTFTILTTFILLPALFVVYKLTFSDCKLPGLECLLRGSLGR